MKRESILIVDDTLEVLKAKTNVLVEAGYEVRWAGNGQQAVRSFRADPPDLVLLDVMMPVMDGYETCAELRKMNRDVPVLFLSALEDDKSQIRGLEVGGDDYVPKTASDDVMLARVKRALVRAARFRRASAPEAMTRVESAIYRLLKSEPERTFNYQEIASAVFGSGYNIGEGTIRSHLSHIRRKLPKGETIEMRRFRGFQLSTL